MCGVVEGDSFLIFRIETWANDMSVFETNILSQFCDLNSAIVHKMETILSFAVLLLASVNLSGGAIAIQFELPVVQKNYFFLLIDKELIVVVDSSSV